MPDKISKLVMKVKTGDAVLINDLKIIVEKGNGRTVKLIFIGSKEKYPVCHERQQKPKIELPF